MELKTKSKEEIAKDKYLSAIALMEDNETCEGKWVNNQNGTYTCDQCGCKHSRSNYCPDCGAKMR